MTAPELGRLWSAATFGGGAMPGFKGVPLRALGDGGVHGDAESMRALDRAVRWREAHGMGGLNTSFSASPRSWTWDDLLAEAVMKARQAWIVVVASAGSAGPDPMTTGARGSVPRPITVGATTDSFMPADRSDDRLAGSCPAGTASDGASESRAIRYRVVEEQGRRGVR